MKKILILLANSNSTERLRLDVEVREIQNVAKARREQLEVVAEWAIGVDSLHSALLDHQPNIVHFSGHGAGSNGLVLENYSGKKQFVSTASLADLFKLVSSTVECLFLNACYSIEQADDNICRNVQKLPKMHLAVNTYLAGYPQIQNTFEQRLPLLPKLLEIEQASSQEVVQIQEWLLESLKE